MKSSNSNTLKEALHQMIEAYRLKGRLSQTRIKATWKEIMGPSVARHTMDIRIRRNVLYVDLDSSPLRQELDMGREKIREKVNAALGEEFIEKVVLR